LRADVVRPLPLRETIAPFEAAERHAALRARCHLRAVLHARLYSVNQKQVRNMTTLPQCPRCGSEHTYEDGNMYVCPECAHEWTRDAVAESGEIKRVVRDAYGNVLNDGDSVTVIKDLKVKGSSTVVKVGTKVKNIRLVEGDHDIDCRIDGIGAMGLKSEFVRKA
jgi:protein PhnA